MAINREPEKPQLESSEEEEDSSSEENDSESEPEPEPKSQPQITKKPSPSKPQPRPQPQPPSSSEEESDSDSDEPVPSRKPIAKPAASEPVTPGKLAAKRPAEKKEPETKEAKKSKKAEPRTETKLGGGGGGGTTSDSSKKVLFQRLWSDDDEIVILQGMIDYAEKKKTSPLADLDAFLEFIRKNLQCDVNKGQLQDKIRRLKKKYENIKSNKRNLTKRHEQDAYALSTKIWVDEKGREVTVATPGVANEGAVKRTPSKKGSTVENGTGNSHVVSSEEVANGGVDKLLVANGVSSYGLSGEERVLKIGAQLFEGANSGVEGAEEWRRLVIEDMEANLKQLDVMRERTKLVLDVLKSANQ